MKKLLMRKDGIVHTVRESDTSAVLAKKAAGFEVIGSEETEADEISSLVNEAVEVAVGTKVEALVKDILDTAIKGVVDAHLLGLDEKINAAVKAAITPAVVETVKATTKGK